MSDKIKLPESGRLVDCQLVLIEWVDSFGSSSSWAPTAGTKEPEPVICRSVGWLLVDGKNYKIVVPHIHPADDSMGTEESGCGDMAIPTAAVKKIHELDWVGKHARGE